MLVHGVGQWLPKIMGEIGYEIGDALLVSTALNVGGALLAADYAGRGFVVFAAMGLFGAVMMALAAITIKLRRSGR